MRRFVFLVFVVLLTVSVQVPHAAAEGPRSWTLVTLRPLAGDGYGMVMDVNAAGVAVGASTFCCDGEPQGRPVMWDANGTPTELPLPAGVTMAEARAIATDGTIMGWAHRGGLLVWRNGQVTNYPEITLPPVAIADDGRILFVDGTVRRLDGSAPTILPREGQASFRDMDLSTGRVVGSNRGGGPFTGTTEIATLWDDTGAHPVSPEWWPHRTAATAIRGDFVGVNYTVGPFTGGTCQMAALHYRDKVYALDRIDEYSLVADVTSFGVAVGSRTAQCEDVGNSSEAVVYVYGHVIPLSQLVAPPEGFVYGGAGMITDQLWIYGSMNDPSNKYDSAASFLIRPGGLPTTG